MFNRNELDQIRVCLAHGQTEMIFSGNRAVWVAGGTVSMGSACGFRRDAFAQAMARDCTAAAGKLDELNRACTDRRPGDLCVCL